MLSVPLYSEDVYEITESELTELELILTEQRTTIDEQAETLTTLYETIDRQANSLTTLQATIETQGRTMSELQTSFDAYEIEARRRTFKVGIVSFAVGGIVGIIGGLIVW